MAGYERMAEMVRDDQHYVELLEDAAKWAEEEMEQLQPQMSERAQDFRELLLIATGANRELREIERHKHNMNR